MATTATTTATEKSSFSLTICRKSQATSGRCRVVLFYFLGGCQEIQMELLQRTYLTRTRQKKTFFYRNRTNKTSAVLSKH